MRDVEAGWKLLEAAGGQERLMFEAHTMVAHDDGSKLLFVDLMHGLILLFRLGTAMARCVAFPYAEDDSHDLDMEAPATRRGNLVAADVEEAARRRGVGFSEGRLYAVQVSRGWHYITVSHLQRHDKWTSMFKVSIGEAFWSNPTIGSRVKLAAAGVGPIDPTNSNKMTFFVLGAKLEYKRPKCTLQYVYI